MSLELYSAELKAIDALWQAWETKSDYELEATFGSLDYTSLLNVIKHLRGLGLQEQPQVPKLNIMVFGGLRFTLEGDGVIQEYCKDNTLRGKPFTVMLKERKFMPGGPAEIDVKEYDLRIKLRHELDLEKDDHRVQDALKKWNTIPKAFRYIKRYRFLSTHQKGIQFDASFIRENKKDLRGNYLQTTTFAAAQLYKQDIKYEMEIEAVRSGETKLKSFLVSCAIVLRGLQRSYVLTRNSVQQSVLRFMASKTETVLRQVKGRSQGFPGPKPVTLRKEDMVIDRGSEIANIRYGDYNVNDKADGLRSLLVVDQTGKIYLIDQNLAVYGTDRFVEEANIPEMAGIVLDGEWITQDKQHNSISHYYAFDIFNGKKGEDVTGLPFLRRGDEEAKKLTRHQIMSDIIASLSMSKSKEMPQDKYKLGIFMKQFYWAADPTDPVGIFKEASKILDRFQRPDAPYNIDGLIFTPNADPLPKNTKTWHKVLKWKPATMNSVDFLVVTEKERSSDGKQTSAEHIQFLETPSGKMERCKTLHLYVGSSIDQSKIDPRDTILQKRSLPSSDRATGPYRPIEFYVSPADQMVSICHLPIHTDITDISEDLNNTVLCEETNEPINDKTIVEMIYKPEQPPGWRWVPMRVRWDKTELYSRGEISGTMNDISSATSVFNSIHDPITEKMIRTGSMTDDSVDIEYKQTTYYKRKAGQDRYITGGMVAFHNQYIKDKLLLSTTIQPGSSLIDMSVGRAGDMHKWIGGKVGWVLGCDIALSGLIEPDGAYDRYLKQMIVRKGAVPKMIFVNADSAMRYSDGSAGLSPMDSSILRCLWGSCGDDVPPAVMDVAGKAADGFDIATSMFALHYFFKNKHTIDMFLTNLAETVKSGGYFVGCCTDGNQVSELLSSKATGESESGSEGDKMLWKITKQYKDTKGFLPSDESGLGRAIDVYFVSIGETHTEYLVSWEYLKSRVADIGFELLNDEELKEMGLKYSTNLFGSSYDMAKENGLNYSIPQSLKTFSFLSRWFIFRRQTMTKQLKGGEIAVETEKVEQNAIVESPLVQMQVEQEKEKVFASGPAYQFYQKSAPKDDFKIGDKQWRRYLSTFYPFTFKDLQTPNIEYSSLEAAIGSAKFQYGTDRPELGPQLFSKQGDIHQETLQKAFQSEQEQSSIYDEEGSKMRNKQKATEMKKAGASWNQAKWDEKQQQILREYVEQRYAKDEHFKKILAEILNRKSKLVYYSPGQNDLGGSIQSDESIDGANIYGRILMGLVNLYY